LGHLQSTFDEPHMPSYRKVAHTNRTCARVTNSPLNQRDAYASENSISESALV
jgi:hypothetical protein